MFKKIARYTLYLGVATLSFWITERLVHKVTGGFTILNITDPHPFDERWHLPEPENLSDVKEMLSQRFHQIYAGGQSYAFVSEDDRYILKVTKYKRMRIPLWLNVGSLPEPLHSYRERSIAKKKRIFDATYNSYILAYKHLQQQAHLVYMHLNKTNHLKMPLTLVDKIGIEHKLDADSYEYILQKKGTLTHCYIDNAVYVGDIDRAKRAIRSLMEYMLYRASLGLEDHDICFGTNYGFFDEEAFQIDIGSLRYNDSFKNLEVAKDKVREGTREFRGWIKQRHPDLLSYFDKTLVDLSK